MVYVPGDYDSAHAYVQWGGKLPGSETWSCGIRLRRKTGEATAVEVQNLLVGTAAAVAAFHTSEKTNLGSAAKLSWVKCNAIARSGHYLDGSGTVQAFYSDLPGASPVAMSFPNQVALAVTLTTGYSRGPAHKGRFYLPLFASSLGTDGLVPAANADLCSQGVDDFLTALNAVSPNYEAAVFSRKAGAAGNRKITGNLVGRALDTQRRRRRSLVEDYK